MEPASEMINGARVRDRARDRMGSGTMRRCAGRLRGLFAHSNFTDDCGPGDPGPVVAAALVRAKGWVEIG